MGSFNVANRQGHRLILSVAFVPALALIVATLFSARVGTIIALFWPLWLAWRFDNQSGTFLVLTMLVYVVIAILLVLMALMVVTH